MSVELYDGRFTNATIINEINIVEKHSSYIKESLKLGLFILEGNKDCKWSNSTWKGS